MDEYEREQRAVALHVIEACLQAWAYLRRARYNGTDKRRFVHPFWTAIDRGTAALESKAAEDPRAARLAARLEAVCPTRV